MEGERGKTKSKEEVFPAPPVFCTAQEKQEGRRRASYAVSLPHLLGVDTAAKKNSAALLKVGEKFSLLLSLYFFWCLLKGETRY